MLEIFAIIGLCTKNSKNAKARGKSGGAAVAYTLALWIGFEIFGAIIGAAAVGGTAAYVFALLFAIIGGIISYAITKSGEIVQTPQAVSVAYAAPNTIFCSHCGASAALGSGFCSKCGKPIRLPVAEAQNTAPQTPTTHAPTIQAPAAQPAPAAKKYFESDNRGMLVNTMSKSLAYWLGERFSSPRKDPFVYYIFTNAQDAEAAMLDLPYIHLAYDTGNLVCDHLFRYGYFAVTNNGTLTGEYDAFIAGADLTHEMWTQIHEVFKAHNGTKKNDLEPEKTTATTAARPSAPPAGDAAKVRFVRENRKDASVWRTHSAPTKADAVAFLATQSVTQPLYYVVVETPEGNYGRDKDGFYQE